MLATGKYRINAVGTHFHRPSIRISGEANRILAADGIVYANSFTAAKRLLKKAIIALQGDLAAGLITLNIEEMDLVGDWMVVNSKTGQLA